MLCVAHVSTLTHTLTHIQYFKLNFILLGPPSAPQNIGASDVTNTSVIIMWEPPQDNGNRTDVFYSISHNVTDDVFNTTSTNMMLTGLIPFVYVLQLIMECLLKITILMLVQ